MCVCILSRYRSKAWQQSSIVMILLILLLFLQDHFTFGTLLNKKIVKDDKLCNPSQNFFVKSYLSPSVIRLKYENYCYYISFVVIVMIIAWDWPLITITVDVMSLFLWLKGFWGFRIYIFPSFLIMCHVCGPNVRWFIWISSSVQVCRC